MAVLSDLTVFVGTFNRTDTLAYCLHALSVQSYPLRVVIVDNGSRHPSAISYLEELSSRYPVYRMPATEDVLLQPDEELVHGGHGMAAVQRNYSEAFRQECAAGRQTRWFAVCDCDTAPDGPEDSIERYVALAEELDCAVGPHLRLNVHRNYPLRSAAIILNARVLFRERMEWWDDIPYSFDPIDSPFHLFPAGNRFARLEMRTVRVGPPWWTTHTDWLIDVCNPTEENHAYILGSGDAASWGGNWIREMFSAWLRSPEEAFALVSSARKHNDYFYAGFILSWMLQYGHGCEIDLERSKAVLHDAFPDWSPCWDYFEHWDALLDGDETCLGWT